MAKQNPFTAKAQKNKLRKFGAKSSAPAKPATPKPRKRTKEKPMNPFTAAARNVSSNNELELLKVREGIKEAEARHMEAVKEERRLFKLIDNLDMKGRNDSN